MNSDVPVPLIVPEPVEEDSLPEESLPFDRAATLGPLDCAMSYETISVMPPIARCEVSRS